VRQLTNTHSQGAAAHQEAPRHGVAAQVEIESKIEAKLKAVYHILVSNPSFQELSTWVP
jgi:hypothetical protein